MTVFFSAEGYTSISVREPLANIRAQTNKQNAQERRREIADSHYATVSDDSGIHSFFHYFVTKQSTI